MVTMRQRRRLSLPAGAVRAMLVEMEVTMKPPRTRIERPPPPAPVDFSEVAPEHVEIDRRLLNWARSHRHPERQAVSAGFDRVTSDTWEKRSYGALTATGVDHEDAQKIAAGVAALPTRLRLVLSWFYVMDGHNPAGAARDHCISVRGLRELVWGGRQMLVDRGV